MAYTTAVRDTSSNTARYTRDKWASSVNTPVAQLQTTAYWIAQGKMADARVWTFSTTEPVNV
jgi:hypothetical protein